MSTKITNSLDQSEDWINWVGKAITKYSNKPFKSGERIDTAIAIVVNPNSGKKAFIMSKDGTFVDCFRTHLV
jgi:hypothetical protein